MNKTSQPHQLRQSWEIEDYTKIAQQSAQVSQQYHRLITQQHGVFQAEIDGLKQELRLVRQDQQRIRGLAQDGKLACVFWGATSAIVAGCLFQLVMAPNPQPQIQNRPSVQYRYGGQLQP